MQAQAVEQAGGDPLALGIAGGMTGVLHLVAVHGPDGATGQLGKRPEPVARLQEAVEDLIGAKGHLGDHGGAALRMERVEPGGAGERFASVLSRLEEVPAGIALAQDALEAAAQKLLVAQLRCVPPVAAMIAQEPQRRLVKGFVHHRVGRVWFHVAITTIQSAPREHRLRKKPPRPRRPGRAGGRPGGRIKSLPPPGRMAARASVRPLAGLLGARRKKSAPGSVRARGQTTPGNPTRGQNPGRSRCRQTRFRPRFRANRSLTQSGCRTPLSLALKPRS